MTITSTSRPVNGALLPALPVPLPGFTPSAEDSARILALVEESHARASAAGAEAMRARVGDAGARLDGIAAEHAARAERALHSRDYAAAAEQAAAAHAHAVAADAIRRAVSGDR